MEATVRTLLDEAAIRDLVRRYAHFVWRRDAAGAAALFTPDAVMDTGDGPALAGRAEILAAYTARFASAQFRPVVANHIVDVAGDRATGTAYLNLRAEVDGTPMEGWGYYDDRYVRTAEEWRFAARRLHLEHFGEAGTPS